MVLELRRGRVDLLTIKAEWRGKVLRAVAYFTVDGLACEWIGDGCEQPPAAPPPMPFAASDPITVAVNSRGNGVHHVYAAWLPRSNRVIKESWLPFAFLVVLFASMSIPFWRAALPDPRVRWLGIVIGSLLIITAAFMAKAGLTRWRAARLVRTLSAP